MSLFYETLGRLVVEIITRRYRRELRLISAAAVLGVLGAVLWAIFGRQAAPGAPSPGRSGTPMGERRKRRPGAILSIR